MTAPSPIRWVWKRHLGLMITSLVIMVLAPYLGSLPVRTIPAVVALASDAPAPSAELELFLGPRAGDLAAVLGFLIVAGGLAFALTLVNTRVAARLSSRSNRDLRTELHRRLLSRPPDYLRAPGVADMLRTAILNQTRVVATYATNTLPAAIGVLFAVVIWAQTLYSAIDIPGRRGQAAAVVGGVVALLLVINLVAVWVAGRKSQSGQREVMREQGAFIGLATESVANLSSLQLNVAQDEQHRRVIDVLERMSRAEVRVAAWGGLAAAAGSGVVMLGIPVLVLAWKGLDIGGAGLAVMIPALLMLQRSISSVGSLWTTRKVSLPAIELVRDMMAPAPAVPTTGRELEKAAGRLVFQDVAWTVEEQGNTRHVLRGVTLDVEPGETVALVGAGGCGKSSLLSLALRLHEPVAGTIALDGDDVGAVAVDALRRRVGVLEQHPAFFARSLRANLAVDGRDVGDDRIMAAARVARIDELVDRVGLDNPLPQGGKTLSGSEKRRLALVRLLLREPDVLLIDELEAGLPQSLAQELLAAVRDETRGKTCLMVTHRPDLLAADRVALLHEGCIVDIGTHAELAERSEPYRTLLEQQRQGDSA